MATTGVSLTDLFDTHYSQVCFSYPHGPNLMADMERVIDEMPECLAGPVRETDDCVRDLAAGNLRGSARRFLSQRVVVSMTRTCGRTKGWVGDGVYRPCGMVDLFRRLFEALHGPGLVCVSNANGGGYGGEGDEGGGGDDDDDDDDDDDYGHTHIRYKWHDGGSALARRLRAIGFQGQWEQVRDGLLGGESMPERLPHEHCHALGRISDADRGEMEQAVGACSFCGPAIYARCLYQSLLFAGSYSTRWLASVMQGGAYRCAYGRAECSRGVILGRAWVPANAKEALETTLVYLLRGIEVCTTRGTVPARRGALVISS